MTLALQLERLYNLSGRGIALGLDRVSVALERLGNPHMQFPTVQIAGTNGKGTVSMLVAHAAACAGLKTGLFTSPHLHRFSERIRINGIPCEDDALSHHLAAVFDVMDSGTGIPLTFFEVATLAALSLFSAEKVDLAVLEVGLGGRLDATTAATPMLTAVTSIGLDHQALLGNSLAAIAAEKAGIARRNTPLILGRVAGEALKAIEATARTAGAPVFRLGRDYQPATDVSPPWPGEHQRDNLAVASALFRELEKCDSRCTEEVFRKSLRTVVWPGRFEKLDTTPSYLIDCAHNPAAVASLVQTLTETRTYADVLLFGALQDKPAATMSERLRPFAHHVVLVPPPIGRALSPNSYANPGDIVCLSVEAGIAEANRLASDEGIVLTTGSIFTVAAVRGILLNEPSDPPIGL